MRNLPRIIQHIVVPLLIAASVVGIFVWREHSLLKDADLQEAEFNTTEMVNSISNNTKIAIVALNSTQGFFLGSEKVTAKEYKEFLDRLFTHLPELSFIQYIDKNNIGSHIYPAEGDNLRRSGLDYNKDEKLLPLLEKAKRTRLISAGRPEPLTQGFPGLLLAVPIYRDFEFRGTILGQLRLPKITDQANRISERSGMSSVIRTGDRIAPLTMNAIYTTSGERLIYPSIKVLDNTAPLINDITLPIQRRFFVADSEWYILSQAKEHTILTGHKFSLLLSLFFLIVLAVLLVMLDRELQRQQEASARERDFLSLVSHQLRLPLTQLNWSNELLMERSDLAEDAREIIVENHQISTGASKLVMDLLNISRIDRGVLKLDLENVDLAELMDETLLTLRQVANESDVELSVASIPKTKILVDRQKIIEAIRNVIDNAIKYGKDGKIVRVSTEEKISGFVTINIQDYGSGIKEEKGKNIFDKASAFSKKEVGTGAGLGLYLTKQFVDLMGGEISFESKPGNTIFRIKLPLAEK